MSRMIGGMALVLHGLAHAALGAMAASSGAPPVIVAICAAAAAGFVAAGLGVVGVQRLVRWWTFAASGATFASMIVLARLSDSLFLPGIVADIAVLSVLIHRRLSHAR